MMSSDVKPSSAPIEERELVRQLHVTRCLLEAMGGSLPREQLAAKPLQTVLDVGCGAGGWALDVAGRYPMIRVTGVDSSAAHVAYAQRLANEGGRDHVGGNFRLQTSSHVPVAAHCWEGQLINNRNPEACGALYLRQQVEPYQVERLLEDGEELVLGKRLLRIVHTPGHTLGHVSLYLPQEKILICGDAVHNDDVAWINPFREGVGALERAMQSLDRLAQLDVRVALSGHGPLLLSPQEAIDRARRRYEQWIAHPEKMGWHACKRIFAYALMFHDGLAREQVAPYLLSCPWFADYSQQVFHTQPSAFVQPFLEELIRTKAVQWNDDRLVATTPYTRPPEGWASPWTQLDRWPAQTLT